MTYALTMGYLPETGRDFKSRAEFNRAWLRAFIRAPRIETLRILVEGPERAQRRLAKRTNQRS
jgi:hypothetical protein